MDGTSNRQKCTAKVEVNKIKHVISEGVYTKLLTRRSAGGGPSVWEQLNGTRQLTKYDILHLVPRCH